MKETISMNEKLSFLINSSKLYRDFTYLTKNDCLRRFLAFKVILNCMSFEDLVNNRQFESIRQIRNVFLAHKQEGEFFDAFRASNLIKSTLIDQMITFMEENAVLDENEFPELYDDEPRKRIFRLTEQILSKFEQDYFSGFRLSNNFLCSQKGQISEISSGHIASVFYRYNNSKYLSFLSNYFISNLINYSEMGFVFVLRNAKIDYVLHAVNMYDSIFKDSFNKYSIDGLYEVLLTENIGNVSALDALKNDSGLLSTYDQLRHIRNKLAGHMDQSTSISDLICLVDQLNLDNVFDFVNKLDRAIFDTAQTHIAIRVHNLPNEPGALKIRDESVVDIQGFENDSYFNQ